MNQFIKYVGLDTHKDTIAVAIADTVGGKPRFYGEIANTATALSKLLKDVVTGDLKLYQPWRFENVGKVTSSFFIFSSVF